MNIIAHGPAFSSELDAMKKVDHEIAPKGDAILVVKNPNAPFASCPWPSPTESECLDMTVNAHDDVEPTPEVRSRVSSAHLKFVSPVFDRALSEDWKEATTLRESGSVEMETSDWDIEALLLLLRILHFQLSNLPQNVDIELLAKLLVLVDYYECHSLLGFIAGRWRSTILYSYHSPVRGMIRLWVAWSLNQVEDFRFYSSKLIQRVKGPVISFGLPLSSKVINELNKRREAASSCAIQVIQNQENDWDSQESSCGKICKFACLGILREFMVASKISVAYAPYEGVSLHDLTTAVAQLKVPKWREWMDERPTPGTVIKPHECKNTKFIDLLAILPSVDVEGLKLADFKSDSGGKQPTVKGSG
ncbi:hypothetical protein BJY00DRAFT_308121 [Aspergillus carlsbadensis]|nr:hypothetical protein BJY00DRAFT_308121 [Aspergillus carlsbadensis]